LVTNEQLNILVGVPMLFNATLIGLVVALFKTRFDSMDKRFDAVDKRFDDMRDLWRAELRRVEEVLDAGFEAHRRARLVSRLTPCGRIVPGRAHFIW
jgi:hypothetical protein